jgi:hypothetical protein
MSTPVDEAYPIKDVDLALPVVLALLFARGLRTSSRGGEAEARLQLDDIVESGFVVLGEEPDRELVLGIVGKFWQLSSGVHRHRARRVCRLRHSGVRQGGLELRRLGARRRVQSRDRDPHRVHDAEARRQFSRYWWLIGRFSALIRARMLRNIKRDAESAKVAKTRGPWRRGESQAAQLA